VGSVKWSYKAPIAPACSSSPRAAPEPLTSREARDRMRELSGDDHRSRVPRSPSRQYVTNWAPEWNLGPGAGVGAKKKSVHVLYEKRNLCYTILRRGIRPSRPCHTPRATGKGLEIDFEASRPQPKTRVTV
jgi:hypothetical protein